jgi:SAM-dependent methyltransferase
MRESIKQFVQLSAETLPVVEPVYEFGAIQVPGQEEFANLRPFFPGKEYVGTDMFKGPGVDVVLNLHEIDLPEDSIGTALVLDTLEHVEFPRKAMEEVFRVLKPDGIAVISSCMNFPIHGYPYDYWRFTPEAFKSLLRPFASSFAEMAGDQKFPEIIVGVGFKGAVSDEVMAGFLSRAEPWKKRWSRPGVVDYSGSIWRKRFKDLTPPILFRAILSVYQKFKPFGYE